jgi:TonB family protein
MLRLLCAMLCAAAACAAQDTMADESVVGKLNATMTSLGVLQGTLVVTAAGTRSAPYREAFVQGTARTVPPALLGRFAQTRETHIAPVVTDRDNRERPVKIQFNIHEDDFILPFQRLALLQLDLVPLASASTAQPDGNPRLGPPGTFHEEIALEIPATFALEADSHLSQESAFARYQSDSKTESGKLIIVRELQIKQETVSASSRSELESFWKVVREDQQRNFILRRASHIDLTEWLQSVPADRGNSYGNRAYQQREYDAARILFERATQANPNDALAWNNLGRALAALGKLEEAQKAYERQIAINPKDRFAYNNLGLLQEREGYWGMAVESFRKQIEVHPGDSFAIANLPRELMRVGRWADAEEAASRAAQAQPNNALQRLYVAISRVCQGKAADEPHEMNTALGATPTASLLNDAAYYLTKCDRQKDLAESYVRRALDQLESAGAPAQTGGVSSAIARQNSRSNYLDTYGWLLFNKGETERAIKLLSAAASLAARGEVYANLAQAEAKAGHSEQAAVYWREATFLQPGLLSQVPPPVVPQLESIPALSLDRTWFPLGADLPGDVAVNLPIGQPSYFLLTANADGSVQSVRELDTDDPAARKVSPALRVMKLPVIKVDASPLPSVYIVKLVTGSDGKLTAGRSVAAEAVAIASGLMPSGFPLPDSAAQTPPSATQVNTIGAGVSPPRIIYKVEAEYSEEARQATLEGTVLLRIVVDADGKPRDPSVLRSIGLGLDEKAIAAVSNWQFAPGVKDGQPVNVQAQIEVNFRMLSVKWHVARVEFHAPAGAVRPVIEKSKAPRVPDAAISATATLTFDIDEKGAPVNLRIEKSSDEGWANEVTDALKKWKFTPASNNGSPVSVPCTMDFVRGS